MGLEAQNDTFQPVERIDGARELGVLLLADHARAELPKRYGTLGLSETQLERHIAYDIGVRDVTLTLAENLGVPAVLSTFSRLLIDPNRGMDDPTLVMRISDGDLIPGNATIDADEIDFRTRMYHQVYHQAVREELQAIETACSGRSAVVLSIHSFTPVWRDVARPWEVGILWDADARLALPLINALRGDKTLTVGDNEPYDGALLNDCMYTHGTSEGRAHALVELRQDLIGDPAGASEWAARLADLLRVLLKEDTLYERQYFPSRGLERVGL